MALSLLMYGVLTGFDAPEILVIVSATVFVVIGFLYLF